MDNYDTSEDEKDDIKEGFEDRETLKPGKQALGISIEYVRDWTTRDAFREFFQNW